MSTDIPEVLLNAIFAQDEQTDELHRMLLGWEKRAKAAEGTLKKLRAVLAPEFKKAWERAEKDRYSFCPKLTPDIDVALLHAGDLLGLTEQSAEESEKK